MVCKRDGPVRSKISYFGLDLPRKGPEHVYRGLYFFKLREIITHNLTTWIVFIGWNRAVRIAMLDPLSRAEVYEWTTTKLNAQKICWTTVFVLRYRCSVPPVLYHLPRVLMDSDESDFEYEAITALMSLSALPGFGDAGDAILGDEHTGPKIPCVRKPNKRRNFRK